MAKFILFHLKSKKHILRDGSEISYISIKNIIWCFHRKSIENRDTLMQDLLYRILLFG